MKRRIRCRALWCLAVMPAVALGAPHASAAGVVAGRMAVTADQKTEPLAAEANAAYEAKDWAKAGRLYEELSKTPDPPPRVWLRLGVCWRSQGKYLEALGAFDKATQS